MAQRVGKLKGSGGWALASGYALVEYQYTDTLPRDEVPADGGHVSERTGGTSHSPVLP